MSDAQPLVSILAANYNNKKYVIEALESIKSQSYPNIELIIVDDASKDDSPELIEQWLKSYNKPYKFIRHPENMGICRTCNDLVKAASGKYISFIATDDMYLPDKIKHSVEVLENSDPSVAIVYSDTYLIDGEGSRKFGTFMTVMAGCTFDNAPSGDVLLQIQEKNFLHWITVLAKREIYEELGYYDEKLSFEDYDMSIRVARKYKVIYTDNVQTLYRVHGASFSRKATNWDEMLWPLYIKHIDLPLFRSRVKDIIFNSYLLKRPEARKWVEEYLEHTKEKLPYYNFIKRNVPPILFRLSRKVYRIIDRN